MTSKKAGVVGPSRVETDLAMGSQRWIEPSIRGSQTNIVLFTPEGHEDRVGGPDGNGFVMGSR